MHPQREDMEFLFKGLVRYQCTGIACSWRRVQHLIGYRDPSASALQYLAPEDGR